MPTAPVIVELRGRLGNQLFEFGAGYAVSRRLGCELAFSSRRLGPAPLELPRVIGGFYREASTRQLLRVGRFEYGVRGRRFVDFALARATLRGPDSHATATSRSSTTSGPSIPGCWT